MLTRCNNTVVTEVLREAPGTQEAEVVSVLQIVQSAINLQGWLQQLTSGRSLLSKKLLRYKVIAFRNSLQNVKTKAALMVDAKNEAEAVDENLCFRLHSALQFTVCNLIKRPT